MRDPAGADPLTFANSTRALLTENPDRYVNFGVMWFFVKALLRRVFDKHEMPMLGDYEDASVIERMPVVSTGAEALALAIEEYQRNASFNLGSNRVLDRDGEEFCIIDPDMV